MANSIAAIISILPAQNSQPKIYRALKARMRRIAFGLAQKNEVLVARFANERDGLIREEGH